METGFVGKHGSGLISKMVKFKLSRRRKKQWKKDDICYGAHAYGPQAKCSWEWFYFRKRVEIRGMEIIVEYPKIISSEELLKIYQDCYPNDKLAHTYCKENRHRWDKFNNPV